MLLSSDSHKKSEALSTFHSNALVIDQELQSRGQIFLGGKCLPGMVDYMIWPWMERLDIASHLLGQEVLPTSQFPTLVLIFIILYLLCFRFRVENNGRRENTFQSRKHTFIIRFPFFTAVQVDRGYEER